MRYVKYPSFGRRRRKRRTGKQGCLYLARLFQSVANPVDGGTKVLAGHYN